jgi:hypothetical protein
VQEEEQLLAFRFELLSDLLRDFHALRVPHLRVAVAAPRERASGQRRAKRAPPPPRLRRLRGGPLLQATTFVESEPRPPR